MNLNFYFIRNKVFQKVIYNKELKPTKIGIKLVKYNKKSTKKLRLAIK